MVLLKIKYPILDWQTTAENQSDSRHARCNMLACMCSSQSHTGFIHLKLHPQSALYTISVYVTYRYKVRCINQSHQWVYHLEWNKRHFHSQKQKQNLVSTFSFMSKHPLFRVQVLPLGRSHTIVQYAACSCWQFPGRLAVVSLPIGWTCEEERNEAWNLDHCCDAISDLVSSPLRNSAYLFHCCKKML